MPRSPLIVVAAVATLLAGCETVDRTVSSLTEEAEAAVAPSGETAAGQELYAASDRLAVHAQPSAGSPVLGRLPLHARVTRSGLDSGYAYITASTSSLRGWVDNTQLAAHPPAGAGDQSAGAPPPRPRPSASPATTAPARPPAGSDAPAANPAPAPAEPAAAAATDPSAPPVRSGLLFPAAEAATPAAPPASAAPAVPAALAEPAMPAPEMLNPF